MHAQSELPRTTKDFLSAFYKAYGVSEHDVVGKIAVLRKNYLRSDCLVASTGQILSDEPELRALEFYVLQSVGFDV